MRARVSRRAVHKAKRAASTKHARAKAAVRDAHVGAKTVHVRTVNAVKGW